MVEQFTIQLDGCSYCPGGRNCTCACHAMWMYRATQGRVSKSACTVRRQTGDTTGGTSLRQMSYVSTKNGISGGSLWLPGRFDRVRSLILTGRYATHANVGYNILANTQWDCFDGSFRGAHDLYIRGGDANDAFYGDPGADGRRPSVPHGWQRMPWEVMERANGALPLVTGGPTLAQEMGSGYIYAYLTPPDPLETADRFLVVIDGNTTTRRTPLYDKPNGTRVGAVSDASYIVAQSKVSGLWWYRIETKANGQSTANRGRWFKPNGWMTWRSV